MIRWPLKKSSQKSNGKNVLKNMVATRVNGVEAALAVA